jgi:uncharacterized protein YdiU (UPF0061 family)
MTYKEIMKEISDRITIREFAMWEVDEDNLEEEENETYDQAYERKKKSLNEVKQLLGEIKSIPNDGVHEDENFNLIEHFVNHNVYVKITGYYSSYDGYQFSNGWNACVEVFPK